MPQPCFTNDPWPTSEGISNRVANLLSLKEVPSGAHVTLASPYDAGALYGRRAIGGIKAATLIQASPDLLDSKCRVEEAADLPLNEVIRKS